MGRRRALALGGIAALLLVLAVYLLARGGGDEGPLDVARGRFTRTGASMDEARGVGVFVRDNTGDRAVVLQRVTVRRGGEMRFLGARVARRHSVSTRWPPRLPTDPVRGFRIPPGEGGHAIYVGVEFDRPGRYVVAPRHLPRG